MREPKKMPVAQVRGVEPQVWRQFAAFANLYRETTGDHLARQTKAFVVLERVRSMLSEQVPEEEIVRYLRSHFDD